MIKSFVFVAYVGYSV